MSEQPTFTALPYDRLLEYEQRGLVTRTFRRLDPGRQQAVLDAIFAEAAEFGPAALNIKRVAERSGTAVGSLYQYFGSRQGLLDFAIELVVSTTVDLFNSYRSLLADMPLREALAAYLAGGLEWSSLQPGLVGFFAAAAYQGDPRMAETVVRPVARVMRETVGEILCRAHQRGEIRPDVDLEAAAGAVNTLLIAGGDVQLMPALNVYYQALNERVTPERLTTAVLALILDGLTGEGPR